ncbi:Gfo/Idh/MocA family protein [Agaribacter marinus]|uniref:Oxidoreductase n=1 Tax=Agaribacter marinus TaxID=1431249 RepID=A0AA37WJS2_9ALTE|nr:Gfo/Idh/MocA family oxidoreductase [Agaribacter marinus]GLR70534.1 oxidoreductase [Agaribacter marinus]
MSGQVRKIRMGMVGGGEGAFIGVVHRLAASLDGEIELVCGAFSRDAENCKRTGQALFLSPERCYSNYAEMFEKEQVLAPEERMEFVAVVTPNHLHFDVAKQALESGFHVLSDKPATFTLAEANALEKIVLSTGLLYGLTHTYLGYPLVKHAKQLVADGVLGKVTKVVSQYHQGWLATPPTEDNKQAEWRLDPKTAGVSCCMGDIGVHAANLVEYITQDTITEICADLTSTVEGRVLDDDGCVIFKTERGAKGVISASQICVGDENDLSIKVYGDKASLAWRQEEPNSLWIKYQNAPSQLIRVGVGELSSEASAAIRTPAGHPEGYIEAFANIYKDFAKQVCSFGDDTNVNAHVPGIEDAVRGMAFIENVVVASKSSEKWHTVVLNAEALK